MSSHTTFSNVSYTRSPHTAQIFERSSRSQDAINKLKNEVFEDGQIFLFRRPFGGDIYISLFGGENAYFISQMGGHGFSVMFLQAEVDGRQKVIYSGGTYGEDKKTAPELRQGLLEHLKLYLPKEIVRNLIESGYIEDPK